MSRTVLSVARGRRAFTLVEIILVTVIIMILVGIVGPRLVGKSKTAKINATKIQMENLKNSLLQFEIHASRFPTTQEGLEALVQKPSDLTDEEWPDKYVDKVPHDAFGTEFKYTYPSEHGNDFDLLSAGPDKKFGTDDDISLDDESKDSGSGSGGNSNL